MSYVSNVRFGQYLVWQLHIDIFSNNKEKGGGGEGKSWFFFFFLFRREGRGLTNFSSIKAEEQ